MTNVGIQLTALVLYIYDFRFIITYLMTSDLILLHVFMILDLILLHAYRLAGIYSIVFLSLP